MLTAQEVDAIHQREQKATSGPWFVKDKPPNGVTVWWGEDAPICPMRWTDGLRRDVEERVASDAAFIAHARTDIPALLAEVARLQDCLAHQTQAWSEPEDTLKHLASVMRKLLPPRLFAEIVEHLDPLTPFVTFLREYDARMPLPAAPTGKENDK